MGMTITEALAEVKLIQKKAEKKRAVILENLTRYHHVPDPFEKDGGSTEAVRREKQSLKDMEERLVKIRSAIAKANLENQITIGGESRSITDWLSWRREVAALQKQFATNVHVTVKRRIDEDAKAPRFFKDTNDKAELCKLLINVDYSEYVAEEQAISDKLEKLDGQLSLKNATIVIEV